MLKAHRLAALVAVLVVGSVTPARAIPVTYSTSGVFGSTGTRTLRVGTVDVIQFNGASLRTLGADPVTNASFGGFQTLNAPTGSYSLVDTFTLTIDQDAPTDGNLTFTATVTGSIVISPTAGNSSQAFVMFDTPLSQTIGATTNAVTYRIVEADDGRARVDILPASGDVSNINGEIRIAPVPEPGTMALACVALPLLGLGYVRRRRMARV